VYATHLTLAIVVAPQEAHDERQDERLHQIEIDGKATPGVYGFTGPAPANRERNDRYCPRSNGQSGCDPGYLLHIGFTPIFVVARDGN
jgi:hypothetical protein